MISKRITYGIHFPYFALCSSLLSAMKAIPTILPIITKNILLLMLMNDFCRYINYMVLVASEQKMMIMRPYQMSSINYAIEYYNLFKEAQQNCIDTADSEFTPLNIVCVFSPPAEGNKDVQQIQEDLPQEKKITKKNLIKRNKH